jgi:putative peptide zinc metalloprotease protein
MGIVKYGTGNVIGFLKEEEIYRFKLNSKAVFIPFDGQHNNIKLVSKSLDQSAVSVLSYPSLISKYGGPIASRPFVSGDFDSRPVTAHYRVSFDLLNKEQAVDWQLPGYVHVKGNRYSPFLKFMKNVLSLLVRESGF